MYSFWLHLLIFCFFFPLEVRAERRTGTSVSLSGFNADTELSKQVIVKIEAGEIPEILQEHLRIIRPESELGRRFQSRMEQLFRPLAQKDPELRGVRFRYLISANKEPNAYYLTGSQPPTYIFTKGLLQRLKSLEQLLSVPLHESKHFKLEKQLGKHKSSKGEEMLAYLEPITVLHREGKEPSESITALKLITEKATGDRGLFRLLDVHPLPDNAIAVMEAAVTEIDISEGRKPVKPTPFPKDITEMADSATYESYVSREMKRHSYESLTTEGKLRVLESMVQGLLVSHPERRKEFRKQVMELLPEIKTPSENLAYDRVVDSIYTLPTRVDSNDPLQLASAYDVRDRLLLRGREARLMVSHQGGKVVEKARGRFLETQKLIQDFIGAKTYQQAETAARRLTQEIETLKLYPIVHKGKWIGLSFNYRTWKDDLVASRNLFLPQFEFPDVEAKPGKVSWNRFVNWSKKDTSGSILRLLTHWFHLSDRRLLTQLPVEELMHLPEYSGPSLPWQYHYRVDSRGLSHNTDQSGESQRTQLLWKKIQELSRLAENGNMAAKQKLIDVSGQVWNRSVMPSSYEQEWMATSRFLDGLRRDARKLPELVGLCLLETHYEAFYDLNSLDYQSRWDSRQLVEAFSKLLQKDRGKYSKLVRDYFVGREDGKDLFAYAGQYGNLRGQKHVPTHETMGPLVSFMLDDQYQIFSEKETMVVLATSASWGDGFNYNYFYQRFGMDPKNAEELIAELKRFPLRSGIPEQAKHHTEWELGNIAKILIDNFIRKHKPTSLPIDRILAAIDGRSYLSQCPKSLENYLREPAHWPTDPERLVNFWSIVQRRKLFLNALDIKKDLAQKVSRSLERVADPGKRRRLAQKALSAGRIWLSEERERLQRLWAGALEAEFGRDNDTHEYRDSIQDVIHELKGVRYSDRYELFQLLGATLQTQKELSEALREGLRGINKDALESSHWKGVVAEGLSAMLRKRKIARTETFDFLTSPLTDGSLNRYVQRLDEEWESENHSGLRPKPSRKHFEDLGRLIFDGFWSSSFQIRALALKELLLPARQRKNGSAFKEAFDFVAEKLFPEGQPYSREAKRILQARLESIPGYQRGLILAAMMAAEISEREGSKRAHEVGRKIALILEMLGPFETKYGQRMHSYSGTPEPIRQGLGRLKSHADEPDRMNLWELYEDLVPERLRRRLHVNHIEGAGALYVVVSVTVDGKKEASLRLRKPFAEERIERGAEIAERMVHRLKAEEPWVVDLLPEIHAARNMAVAEADSKVASLQFGRAQKLYPGRTIQAGPTTFQSRFVKVYEEGEGWTLMETAKGNPLRASSKLSGAQKTHERERALAQFTEELYLIAKGQWIDLDRHGEQSKESGNVIRHFDPGGVVLKAPSVRARRKLGEILLLSAISGEGTETLKQLLWKEFLNYQRKGEADVANYLNNVRTALLAQGDNLEHLTREDVQGAIRAVRKRGEIHRDILAGFARGSMSHPVRAVKLGISQLAHEKCRGSFVRISGK